MSFVPFTKLASSPLSLTSPQEPNPFHDDEHVGPNMHAVNEAVIRPRLVRVIEFARGECDGRASRSRESRAVSRRMRERSLWVSFCLGRRRG